MTYCKGGTASSMHRVVTALLGLCIANAGGFSPLPWPSSAVSTRPRQGKSLQRMGDLPGGSAVTVQPGDVVVFSSASDPTSPEGRGCLGIVREEWTGGIGVAPLVERLSPGESTTALELHVDEDADLLDLRDLVISRVLEPDSIEERRVGCGFGPSNPHGEESELVYLFYDGFPGGTNGLITASR